MLPSQITTRKGFVSVAAAVTRGLAIAFVVLLAVILPHGTAAFGIHTRTMVSPLPARQISKIKSVSGDAPRPLSFPSRGSCSTTTSTRSSTTTTTTSTSLRAMPGTTTEDLLSNTDFIVFVAGVFPFLWATVEFTRRVRVGESFGTGTDSIVIGMEDSPADSRGRRVLGKGALVTAAILFVSAFATLAVVGYSVVTSEAPSEDDFRTFLNAKEAAAAAAAAAQ